MLEITTQQKQELVSSRLSVGETVSFNHDECPAGTDRKERLYVTRNADGNSLVCYCHNCGEGGRIHLEGPRVRTPKQAAKAAKVAVPKAPPPEGGTVHPDHAAWLRAQGIEPDFRLMFSDDDGLVFYGDGWSQTRGWNPKKPKWKTAGTPVCHLRGPGHFVLVEDILSCIKVWRATTSYSVCLFGNRPTVPDLPNGIDGNCVIVWLDNDNDNVRVNAMRLAQDASSKGAHVCKIEGGTDPKRYTKDQLKEVIDEAIRRARATPHANGSHAVLEIRTPYSGVRAGSVVVPHTE